MVAAQAGVLRVAAFTQGRNVPSARFRVRQYQPALRDAGIVVDEYPARFGSYPPEARLWRAPWLALSGAERAAALYRAGAAELAVFQRELLSTLPSFERFWQRPAVFDVDDAIWLNERCKATQRIAQHCGTVLCGNTFLAEHFSAFAQVVVLPTAVDCEAFHPGKKSDQPLICWSGSSANLPYLLAIEEALCHVLQTLPDARLRVICDRAPAFARLPRERMEFVQWSPETQVSALQDAWVGLMPMPDSPWTRGKCSFKLLTYMACAVAAVASPFGMNAEVLAHGGGLGAQTQAQWAECLVTLCRNPDEAQRLGAQGRQVALAQYSLAALAPRLAQSLRRAASR